MTRQAPPDTLRLDGIALPIHLTARRNARRVTLSVNRATRRIAMSYPPGTALHELQTFLERQHGWIETRVAAMVEPIPLAIGMKLPFRGTPHRVLSGARGVRLGDGCIEVGSEHPAATLERWLRAQARSRLDLRSRHHAGRLGVSFSRLSIKDTRSRWGSCSSRGTLSYSWRVILAPDAVLDYLAAHEVAHLREMNHGARFWRHVEDLCPDFERWRRWLRENGAELHRYGAREG